MKTLLVLGRQPKIGLAEIESLYGPSVIAAVGESTVLLDCGPEKIQLDRLGGTIQICKVLLQIRGETASLKQSVRDAIISELLALHRSKVNFGISSSLNALSTKKLTGLGLSIKSELKTKHKQSSRLITSQTDGSLNTAQIIHNGLSGKKGYEFVLAEDEATTILAATTAVQDIDSYSLRDYGRPKRDSRIGMLPPKLAQIILNLSIGNKKDSALTVLDPFCGTGVILQEALLMGYQIYGSDISDQMISYSAENIAWLSKNYPVSSENIRLEPGDATNKRWEKPFDAIASEVYLGRAYSSYPPPEKLHQNISDTNTILEKFLINLSGQLPKGFRFCLAVPAWIDPTAKLIRLPLLDHLDKLGYNRLSFEHTKDEDLIYYRPTQFVGRELLVIIKR